jgi:hypothetical protein
MSAYWWKLAGEVVVNSGVIGFGWWFVKTKIKASVRVETESQIEQLKHSLQMLAFEQQIRFSRLHKKRADVIAELYRRLIDVPNYAKAFLLLGAIEEKRGALAMEQALALFKFIQQNRIYLPANICERLDAFSASIDSCVRTLALYSSVAGPLPAAVKERQQVLTAAMEDLANHIPTLRSDLEAKFRELLGDVPPPRASVPSEIP